MARNKYYRNHRERILNEIRDRKHPSDDINEEKLNAYWEKERIPDNAFEGPVFIGKSKDDPSF